METNSLSLSLVEQKSGLWPLAAQPHWPTSSLRSRDLSLALSLLSDIFHIYAVVRLGNSLVHRGLWLEQFLQNYFSHSIQTRVRERKKKLEIAQWVRVIFVWHGFDMRIQFNQNFCAPKLTKKYSERAFEWDRFSGQSTVQQTIGIEFICVQSLTETDFSRRSIGSVPWTLHLPENLI